MIGFLKNKIFFKSYLVQKMKFFGKERTKEDFLEMEVLIIQRIFLKGLILDDV